MTVPAAAFGQDRAARYAMADRLCDGARLAELLPILRCMARHARDHTGTLLEAATGAGAITAHLAPGFDEVIACDEAPAMLALAEEHRGLTTVPVRFVLSPMQSLSEHVAPASVDVACVHTAFHHVFVSRTGVGPRDRVAIRDLDGSIDIAATHALREATIRGLVRLLKPGGLLVVTDVMRPTGDPLEISRPDLDPDALPRHAPIARRLHQMLAGWKADGLSDADLTPRPSAVAEFFDKIVHPNSTDPHHRYYLGLAEMTALASTIEGVEVVESCFSPTPFSFASSKHAAWYLGELFALSPQARRCPDDLPARDEAALLDIAITILGLRTARSGRCVVPWGLACFCLRRR